MLGKLKIVFSAACGVLCLLIVLLWVRSYQWIDAVAIAPSHYVSTLRGDFCLDCTYRYPPELLTTTRELWSLEVLSIPIGNHKVFQTVNTAQVPMGWPLVLVAGLAATPWIAWRISWSVVWGLAAIGILTTWIAMFDDSWGHRQRITSSTVFSIEGYQHQTALIMWWDAPITGPMPTSVLWQLYNRPGQPTPTSLGFGQFGGRTLLYGSAVLIPYWFWILVSVLLGVAPWFRWSKRFSLRTLLVVMTVVAVGLGVVMAAMR